MPLPLDQALPKYQAALDRQRALLSRILTAAWDALDHRNEADIPVLTRQVAPYIVGAQQATTATSTAFNALMLDIAAPPVDPARLVATPNLRDPFTATWHGLSEGTPYADAVEHGRITMEAVGADFVTDVARETGDLVAEAAQVTVQWKRIASSNACDWCRKRDGGIYPSARQGNYGHERCNCFVVPHY